MENRFFVTPWSINCVRLDVLNPMCLSNTGITQSFQWVIQAPFPASVSSLFGYFTTVLFMALVSALLLNKCSSFALLRPNPAFLPKNISSSFWSRDTVLMAFHPLPHSSELHLLFPVWALARYVQRSVAFRTTQ